MQARPRSRPNILRQKVASIFILTIFEPRLGAGQAFDASRGRSLARPDQRDRVLERNDDGLQNQTPGMPMPYQGEMRKFGSA